MAKEGNAKELLLAVLEQIDGFRCSASYVLNSSKFISFSLSICSLTERDIYSGHPPLPGGGFLSKLKNRKNLKEDLKKGRGKGEKEEKRKRMVKHTLKYLYEA